MSQTDDKTEKASPQKLRKAREQGQVARSRELATALALMASIYLTVALLPAYLDDFRQIFQVALADLSGQGTLDNAWSLLFLAAAMLLLKMVLPLLLVPLAGVMASLLPGGWVWSGSQLAPQWRRLNPASNLGRLLSAKHLAGVAASVAKALVLGGVLWLLCRQALPQSMRLQSLPLGEALALGRDQLLSGVLALLLVFLLFGLIDLPTQLFFFLRGQRMSRQEQKEEHKRNEGRPEVKQRIRQLQRQLARRSARAAVPTADVVIVNPEHYAVAIKYDVRRAQAPYVVAKGIDEMALYIRALAREAGVQVLELPPLARAIYRTSQVQQQIPIPLYTAVALVLNHVLQLKAFQAGLRPQQPSLPADLEVPAHLSQADPDEPT